MASPKSGGVSEDTVSVSDGQNITGDHDSSLDTGSSTAKASTESKMPPSRGRRMSPDRAALRRSRSPDRTPGQHLVETSVESAKNSEDTKPAVFTSDGECPPKNNDRSGNLPDPYRSFRYPRSFRSFSPPRSPLYNRRWVDRYQPNYDQDYDAPPLPTGPAPRSLDYDEVEWVKGWDQRLGIPYWYSNFTKKSQWEDPHAKPNEQPVHPAVRAGYNPKIHGSWDPNADYAKAGDEDTAQDSSAPPMSTGAEDYTATGTFNRFTGKFTNTALHPTHTPDAHTDAAKSNRQMNAYFDVAAMNSHSGESQKEKRKAQALTGKELKQIKERKAARKIKKQRDFLTKD